MTIRSIAGIDHAVVAVKDLDAAAANWKQLGFTISPRGTHSAHMGTGNYTIMLGEDYMELLGVLVATEHNAPTRTYLEATGGGIVRVAFTTPSAAAGAAELRTLGYAAIGPTDFERPVTMPDGSRSAAKFATFQWPVAEAPGGVRLFACQHKTRETVWIPQLQQHANTARRIARVFVVTPQPQEDAAHLAKMIAGEVRAGTDGTAVVPTGFGRADFVFLSREALGRRYPGVDVSSLPARAGAGLELVVNDLSAAQRAIGARAVASSGAVVVPPAAANGVLLAFVAG
ncbi:VOC family protein [Bradyrhizobium sp.]|uniref:VOC family protein n=1 Tax=Bradyrhizobium sp. TaxID=376 RepID=UPI001DC50688|nr:VOC family protein [Bradyrhizobium sp.]MBI5322415.1 VOC family protein [Bradyrhizobium sp.]